MIAPPPNPFLPEPAPRRCYDDNDAAGLLVGVPDVAELLGIGRADAWRMVKSGELLPDFTTPNGEALFHPARIAALTRA